METSSRLVDDSPSRSTSVPDLRPTSDTERVAILDVLRGFALYGVLLANLVWLTTDLVLTDVRLQQLPTAAIDPIARALVAFFIDGKFYTLFAFLFGLGFSLQMQRAGTRGTSIVPVYIRRLFVLIVIAVIHIVLIWYGDILLMYASLGFVLLLFRRARPTLMLVMLALVLALFSRAAVTAYHGRRTWRSAGCCWPRSPDSSSHCRYLSRGRCPSDGSMARQDWWVSWRRSSSASRDGCCRCTGGTACS